jgi:hypothetical protein
VATGLLSFYYWWDGTGWYRGQSPEATQIGAAIPGLWTPDTTVDIICSVLSEAVSRPAVTELVDAAQNRSITADVVLRAFDAGGTIDTDLAGAMYQFAVAGLTI